jgi:riboflavin synthase
MFTGIIETMGEIAEFRSEGSNRHFKVFSGIASELKVDQSVSHNGVCLTVTKVDGNSHWCTAIDETLKKTNLGLLKKGDKVNLERCMLNNGRFDGHIVQGHVDQQGKVKSIQDENGSWVFSFTYDKNQGNITVEKGSICVNGVSLTCYNSDDGEFTVAIIPYTFEHTNFKDLRVGTIVNLEFDVIGKYVKKLLEGRGVV